MILIAPTAFKGTLSASRVATALAHGARQAAPGRQVVELPLSDGGPGLLECFERVAARPARADGSAVEGEAWSGPVERLSARVTGPLGAPVDAEYLAAGDTVVIESARACGLELLAGAPTEPLRAGTRGVGELIGAAVAARGPAHLILGLGGSATMDGGAGMAQALGWRLLDDAGRPIAPGAAALMALDSIRRPKEPSKPPARVTVLCDVVNPLLGPMGAAAVFGPQKGASAVEVERVEAGLARLASLIRRDIDSDVAALEGAGAAGGLGAGAAAFLGGELVRGAEWLLERVGFEELLEHASLVLTGEGAVDEQTGMGKVVGRVIERARARGLPVLVVAGRITLELPPGVHGVGGGGRALDAPAIEALAAAGVRELLAAPSGP